VAAYKYLAFSLSSFLSISTFQVLFFKSYTGCRYVAVQKPMTSESCSSLAPSESFQKPHSLPLWCRHNPPTHYYNASFSSKTTKLDSDERRSWSWDIKTTFRLLEVDFYTHIPVFAFPKLVDGNSMESLKGLQIYVYEIVLPPFSQTSGTSYYACLRCSKIRNKMVDGDRNQNRKPG